MLERASPLNPNVLIENKSSTERILLVAWRRTDFSASSGDIPSPLSDILIRFFPESSTSTVILLAPASKEFSSNSLITEAGLSITSPAAILLIRSSGRRTILDMEKEGRNFVFNDLYAGVDKSGGRFKK